jgi:hypothetical protein
VGNTPNGLGWIAFSGVSGQLLWLLQGMIDSCTSLDN